MRQGSNNQSNRRGRGRGHNHQRRSNPNNRNQTFDSNGPGGRIRGNAKQIFEKYLQLAKDAISSGDRVLAESLFQHADHYGRIAAQFAPKPKPETDEAVDGADAVNDDGDQDNDETEIVNVAIEDGDTQDTAEATDADDEAGEEKPKRRTTRRTPRKKADDDAPKLGGGATAVPDFLARPVEVGDDASETVEAISQDADDADEKPKRRTRRTTTTTRKTTTTRTRRKKADEDVAVEA